MKKGFANVRFRTRNLTVGPIAEKGLPCTRPAGKTSAQEALLLCVEIDTADPVLEDLLPTLSHNVPKVIAGALAALTVPAALGDDFERTMNLSI